MVLIDGHVGTSIGSIVDTTSVSLIGSPFPLVRIAPVGIDHFPYPVSFPIRPESSVDASVGIPALTVAVSSVVVEAAVVDASVGIGEYAVTVSLSRGIALANV